MYEEENKYTDTKETKQKKMLNDWKILQNRRMLVKKGGDRGESVKREKGGLIKNVERNIRRARLHKLCKIVRKKVIKSSKKKIVQGRNYLDPFSRLR